MKRYSPVILLIFLFLLSCRLLNNNANIEISEISTSQSETTQKPIITRPPLPTITATNISQPEIQLIAEMGNGTMPGFYRSADGSKLFVYDGYDAQVLDGNDYTEIGTFHLNDDGYGFVFSSNRDGSLALTGSFFGFQVVDVASGERINSASGGNGSTSGETFTNDEKYIIYSRNDRTTGGPYQDICRITLGSEVVDDEESYYGNCYPTDYEFGRYTVTTNPAVSPNGKFVAAGYRDSTHNTIFIWNLESKEIIQKLEYQPDHIRSIDFSPDSSMLVTAADDGIIRFWNPYTGQQIKTINGFTHEIQYAYFNDNPNELIIKLYDQESFVYNLTTGKTSPRVATPMDPYAQQLIESGYMESGGKPFILFSPRGDQVAIADGNIQIWDVKSETLQTSLYAKYSLDLAAMVYSNDGKMIAAANRSGMIYVWDIATSELVFSMQSASLSDAQVYFAAGFSGIGPGIGAETFGEYGITFSEDDTQIIVPNGLDIDSWNISSNTLAQSIPMSDPNLIPFRISTHTNGDEIYGLINRNQMLLTWDISTGKQTAEISLPDVASDVFTATALNGEWLARNNADDKNYWIDLVNLKTGEVMQLQTAERVVEPLRFSNHGKYLAAVIDHQKLSIWETETGKLVFISEPNFTGLADFAIDDRDNILATTNQGQIQLWDLSPFIAYLSNPDYIPVNNTPTPTATYESSSSYPTSTPEPTLIVTPIPVPTTSSDAITESTGKDVQLLKTIGKGVIYDIYWGNNNDTLFVKSPAGLYELNAETMQIVSEFQPEGFWVSNHKQIDEETQLIAGYNNDFVTHVWDSKHKNPLFEFENATEPSISPDGKWLVFANQDNGLTTWNLKTNQQGPDLLSSSSVFLKTAFSPDGKYVATICSYRTARIWELETGKIINTVGGSEHSVTDIQFSEDGKYLVGAAGGDAWIWAVDPNIPPRRIPLFEPVYNGNLSIYLDTVSAIAINSTNTSMAVATSEKNIIFYSPLSGMQQKTIEGLQSVPVKMIFSADGNILVIADKDGRISFVHLNEGKIISHGLVFSGEFQNLIPREDGDMSTWVGSVYYIIDRDDLLIKLETFVDTDQILAGDPSGKIILGYEPYQVSIFSEKDGQRLQTLTEEAENVYVDYQYEGDVLQQFYGAMFSPNGNHFITYGSGGVWQYDSESAALLNHIEGSNTKKAAFSADGEWILVSRNEYAQGPRIYDLTLTNFGDYYSNYWRGVINSSADRISQYLFHPDKSKIALLHRDYEGINRILILNTADNAILNEKSMEDQRLTAEAYSPDGKMLAVGALDGQIYLLDSDSLEIINQWQGHLGTIQALAFTIDGSQLYSTGNEGMIKVWGIK